MFNLNHTDVRNFFFSVYEKSESKEELTDLEKIAYSVILEHPEYYDVLKNKVKYLDYQWSVESGQTNPFLHLSMHLTIIEQLSINQPVGITDLFVQLCTKFTSKHDAEHQLIDCIGEMLWQSQQTNTAPDALIYLDCINKKL